MGDKKKEYRDKRTGMQTVRSVIFAIVLIITDFTSIISVADNTYAADEYRVHKSEVVVKTGATYTVKILNHDTKVSPKKFKWTSSNSKCVKVINGRIYGLKPGQATITAQMSGLKENCEVFVYNKTETVLFKKYKKQVKVTAGKTIILEPQKYGKRLTYTSSDKTVATVSKKGKVTAKKAGNVKITSVSYGTDRYVSEIEVIVLPAASETPEITPTLTPDEPAPSVTPEPTVTVTPTPKITPAPEDEEKFRKPLDGVTHYILHRGEQTEAPENSVPAFEMAGRNGADLLVQFQKTFLIICRNVFSETCNNLWFLTKKINNFLICTNTKCADQNCDRHFTGTVNTNIEDIIRVCLIFQPCTTVRDNSTCKQFLTYLIMSDPVVNTRGTYKLADDNTFCTVNHK